MMLQRIFLYCWEARIVIVMNYDFKHIIQIAVADRRIIVNFYGSKFIP